MARGRWSLCGASGVDAGRVGLGHRMVWVWCRAVRWCGSSGLGEGLVQGRRFR